MNDIGKTALSVVVAGALGFAAWFVTPSSKAPAEFSDLGTVFYPAFTDPLAARSLEVVGVDETSAAYKAFKVEHDGKRWVIPSHHNYPADAEQKMGQAAGAFVALSKEQVASDSAADHASMGVLAPDDEKSPIKGRGVRFTIRGEGGSTLSDLIIGDEVKGGPATDMGPAPSTGRRYVRIPGQNRVYTTTLKGTVSTKFADWIETDLLQLKDAQIASVEVFRGHVDEQTGKRNDTEHVTIVRSATTPPPAQPGQPAPAAWTVNAEPGGPPAEGESIRGERIEESINALKALKIVGVRAKPANLAKALGGGADAAGVKIGTTDVLNLQSKGFYLTQGGQLMANEGEETIACQDGVKYTLWFGEIAAGEGEELTAGLDETAKTDAPKKIDDKKPKGESRYLFITVNYDDSLLGPVPTPPAAKPAAEVGPAGDAAPPDASAAKEATPDVNDAQYKQDVAAREAKAKAGKDRAAALSKRFADWWYVIDASSFDKLRPTRADVVNPKIPPAAGAPGTPGAPAGAVPPAAPQPQPAPATP